MSISRISALLFTLLYTVGAAIYFSSTGNSEFLGYTAVVAVAFIAGGCLLTHQCVPSWLMWLVASIGLLHLLGDAIQINGDVLYNYVPFPIENPAGLTIIKMDQIIHTFGTGVMAVVLYFFLKRDTSFHWIGITVFAILGAMGIGALNEIVEFMAKLMVPDNNVGGYYNTAVDLTVNLLGAIIGTALSFAFWKRPV